MNDPCFRFDFMASPGQEIGATIDEYIDYAASRETTKVIAVFMEAARNPEELVASLKRARDAGKPVIVCKVGRSEESARLARSHAGALAGSQGAYEAVFRECGAICVPSVDALMNTALLCSSGRIPEAGAAGLVIDSGSLREMQVDLVQEMGAPLARLSSQTRAALRAALPAELEPSNPLDCAADLTDDFPKIFDRGLEIWRRRQRSRCSGLRRIRGMISHLSRRRKSCRPRPFQAFSMRWRAFRCWRVTGCPWR